LGRIELKSFKVNSLTAAMLLSFPLMSTSVYAADATENNAQKDEIEVIEVTGILGSLRRAEAVKLAAKNVVEAITAEDIGQFSDDSIAESLQRLPGVQVEEDTIGSSGDKVSIRGLGSQFVVATVNGRTAWGSGTGEGRDLRSFNFNVIPSEVVGQVLVTKTPVADTVESGIGGSVDVQTLRPLEANYKGDKNWIAQVEARSDSTDIGEANWGQRFSGAFIGKNDNDTFGGYLAFNWSDTESGRDRQEVRYKDSRSFFIDHNNDFVADDDEEYDGATTVRDVMFANDRYNLERGAITGALQFNPTDNLSIVADALYTKADSINRRPNTRFDVDRFISKKDINGDPVLFAADSIALADGGLGDMPYHTTYIDQNGIRCLDDGAQLTGTDCTKSNGRLLSMRDQYRNNFRDAFIGGLNVQYDNGPWLISGDIFYNKLDTEVHEISMDANTYTLANAMSVDLRGDDGIAVMHDASDLATENFSARRLRVRQRTNDGEQVGIRLDFEYEIDNDLVESIEFGTRYNKSDFDYVVSQRASWDDGGADEDAFNAAMYGTGFHDAAFGVALPVFDIGASGDYLNAGGYLPDVDGGSSFGPCSAGTVSQYLNISGPSDKLLTEECRELANSFKVDEETINAYVAANLASEIAGIPLFANIGLRYVRTENSSVGVIVAVDEDGDEVIPDPSNLTKTEGSFTEVLPSINVQLDLTDTLQLRLAASKSLSRPDLYDLTPRYKVSTSDGEDNIFDPAEDCAEDSGCSIKRGNPDLKPYTAWNYDATFMWSMPTEGFLALSLYYKDISDFIFEQVSGPVEIPGYPGGQFALQQPENASAASVTGYEIALHQPFTFLPEPFNGFGVQANYSYTDSEFSSDIDEDLESTLGGYGLPGASKNNANAVLYFETERFSARLAYVYRDDYFSSFNGGAEGQPRFFAEQEKLSASVSFDITENLQIKVQGTNLTEDDRKEFTSFETQTTRYTSTPKTYSVSLRGKF